MRIAKVVSKEHLSSLFKRNWTIGKVHQVFALATIRTKEAGTHASNSYKLERLPLGNFIGSGSGQNRGKA